MVKTVSVSGAAGYVGSLTCKKLLDAGYIVRGMDNFYRNCGDSLIELCKNPNFTFFRGDVTNPKDCEKLANGADGIISLAALVGQPVVDRNVELAYLVNTVGTVNLLNARQNDCPYIFASTGSVYGAVKDICREDSPKNPLSHYGKSKIFAEERILPKDNVVCLRFATGMGTSPNIRLDLLVNDLTWRAIHEKALIIFQADFNRVFIDVEDMADCLVFSLENCDKMQQYKVFNAGDESLGRTKREMAEYIKSKTGCYIAYADKGYEDPDQRDYVVSTQLIKSFGWHTKITFEQTMDNLLKVCPFLLPQNNHYSQKI